MDILRYPLEHIEAMEAVVAAAREWRIAFEAFSKDESYRNAFPYSAAKRKLIAALDALDE